MTKKDILKNPWEEINVKNAVLNFERNWIGSFTIDLEISTEVSEEEWEYLLNSNRILSTLTKPQLEVYKKVKESYSTLLNDLRNKVTGNFYLQGESREKIVEEFIPYYDAFGWIKSKCLLNHELISQGYGEVSFANVDMSLAEMRDIVCNKGKFWESMKTIPLFGC